MAALFSLVLNFWAVVYSSSWWGSVNEENGWGSVYPFDADGSFLTVDTMMETSDVTYITTDQTKY